MMKKYVMMVLLGVVFNAVAAPAGTETIEKYIEVSQTQKVQEETYAHVQKNLKDKNIILVFNKMKFTKNRLSYIDFSIDFGDGFSGNSKSEIKGNKEIGFIRDYNENAEHPFLLGDLK